MEERLQKIIARAGIASRRHAEQLIASGFVSVNGQIVTEMGTKADETRDHIKVNGKLLRPRDAEAPRTYVLLHKPPEVVATMSDPEGRQSLMEYLHGVRERVFPVGRLEYHASGLVLLTNDGELANRLMRAHGIEQTYQLKLKTLLTFAEIAEIGRATGARIERRHGNAPWYEVRVTNASSDALRNRLFQSGHPVEKLKRVRLANLELDGLAPGEYRELTAQEVMGLKKAAAAAEAAADARRLGAGSGAAARERRAKRARQAKRFRRVSEPRSLGAEAPATHLVSISELKLRPPKLAGGERGGRGRVGRKRVRRERPKGNR